MITKKMEKEYLKYKGIKCPFCGSDELQGQEINVEAGSAFQDVSCDVCEKEWVDEYTLTGIFQQE